jgi:hypothetical protein
MRLCPNNETWPLGGVSKCCCQLRNRKLQFKYVFSSFGTYKLLQINTVERLINVFWLIKLTRFCRKSASSPSNTIIIFMISYASEMSNTTSEYFIVPMFATFYLRNKSYTLFRYIHDPASYWNSHSQLEWWIPRGFCVIFYKLQSRNLNTIARFLGTLHHTKLSGLL